MSYRILEMVSTPEAVEEAGEMAEKYKPIETWMQQLSDERSSIRFLLDAERIEGLSDELSNRYSHTEGFRIMLYAVEATLPVPEEAEDAEKPDDTSGESQSSSGRISREELYNDVSEGGDLTPVYIGLVVLSALVAGMGLLRDDVAVIIGAMVIAPLLGPNVSMSLAVTLGDVKLGWRALQTNLAGLLLAFGVACLMGLLLTVDPSSNQVFSRSTVSLSDIIIALAAGCAGVLAFTRDVPAAIVGVMVAVALLPPLVNAGLLLGSGYGGQAVGAAILTATNLICINLAGVGTFLVQGVRPRTWWEAEKARKATRIALAAWAVLLALAAAAIWLWSN
ncbi:MAG: TIGR00341 family protein [Balneolaceae bacterium]|nr:TIGR00341 family protein [Balneolaceae bacterium]